MDSQNDPSRSTSSTSPKKRRAFWMVILALVLIGVLAVRVIRGAQQPRPNPTPEDDPESQAKSGRTLLAPLLVGAVIFSALVALADACRARWSFSVDIGTRVSGSSSSATGQSNRRPLLSRQCSLVDLTMSRHERRESAALNHVHQLHQQSLPESHDPPTSGPTFTFSYRCARRRPPTMTRNTSLSVRGSDDAMLGTSSAAVLRRSSSELSDGEASPDSRRRCSRLIRRH